MSHRQKGEHKPRHRTHAIKPASLIHTPLAPLATMVQEHIAPKTVIKSRHVKIGGDSPI